jgi:hypothetical protein
MKPGRVAVYRHFPMPMWRNTNWVAAAYDSHYSVETEWSRIQLYGIPSLLIKDGRPLDKHPAITMHLLFQLLLRGLKYQLSPHLEDHQFHHTAHFFGSQPDVVRVNQTQKQAEGGDLEMVRWSQCPRCRLKAEPCAEGPIGECRPQDMRLQEMHDEISSG